MTSKLAMPVVLIARLSLAKVPGRSGGDGDVEAGIEQAFDALGGLGLIPSEFGRVLGVELHMAGQRGVHAETGEANHRMFGVFEGAGVSA